jgi:hypothetical protein
MRLAESGSLVKAAALAHPRLVDAIASQSSSGRAEELRRAVSPLDLRS